MKVPRAALERYIKLVNGASKAAGKAVRAQIDAVGISDAPSVKDALRTALRAADGVVSEVDRHFYRSLRKLAIGDAGDFPLADVELWTDAYFDKVVDNLMVQATTAGTLDPELLSSLIQTFVENTVNGSSKRRMIDYGEQDTRKPRYARVPSGAETCAWCWAMAGLGFHYMSKETAGHSHAGCDCVIVPEWGDETVEGYDPEFYADKYRQARKDLATGNISDELKERIDRTNRTHEKYKDGYNDVLAVMREKYGLK